MNIGRETETVEHKKSTAERKEAADSIASMLNAHGRATVYFGVKNNGDVIGQETSDQTIREVRQTIAARIKPDVTPVIDELDLHGATIIRVTAVGDDAPYSSAGVYLKRVGDEDVKMPRAELAAMLDESRNRSDPWDRRASQRAIADIDEGELRSYVDRGRASGRISFEYAGVEDALERLELMSGGELTNAADVLFCRSRDVMLKMGVFATDARVNVFDMRQVHGTLFAMAKDAEEYVMRNIKWRFEFTGAMQREEIPELPQAAVREAVINAFCHRSYASDLAVQVDIFPDKVVKSSVPGISRPTRLLKSASARNGRTPRARTS